MPRILRRSDCSLTCTGFILLFNYVALSWNIPTVPHQALAVWKPPCVNLRSLPLPACYVVYRLVLSPAAVPAKHSLSVFAGLHCSQDPTTAASPAWHVSQLLVCCQPGIIQPGIDPNGWPVNRTASDSDRRLAARAVLSWRGTRFLPTLGRLSRTLRQWLVFLIKAIYPAL
jgi:hypothetical protein